MRGSVIKTRWEAFSIASRSLRSDGCGPRESTLLETQQNTRQRRETASNFACSEAANGLARSESSEMEASGAQKGRG